MSWNLLDISTLRDIDLFNHVSDDALVEVLSITQTRRYKAREEIFRQGDPGDALYFILDGEVRISTDVHEVGEEALAHLGDGSCFGEMGLIEADVTRSAHATASTDAHLGIIPREDFLKLMIDDAELARDVLWSFVRTLSGRLRNTNEKVAFFALNEMYE